LPEEIDLSGLTEGFTPRIAFENARGASEIYGYMMPRGNRPAVVVGNERRGIARTVLGAADDAVELPMASRKLNCLNVAAAAGVALYYLTRRGGGRMRIRSRPSKHRSELLIIAGRNHFELGSAIRSAGALGWGRILIEDRFNIWFGCDRVKRSEGRAAARRGKNPIRLIPTSKGRRHAFDEVCVVTKRTRGQPLQRHNLACGPRQLVVLADESDLSVESEPWRRLGKKVTYVHADVPVPSAPYHFRLPATIALAEAARQTGWPARKPARPPKRHEPFFEHALKMADVKKGEVVHLEDLYGY
jgi:hypothetical protein